jgi:serine/threonine protein kinase/tetratricopeptide (TPR) repeat protein
MHRGQIVASRFEIEHLAGEGGMGAVYRARDLHDGAQVALKLLRESKRTSIDEQRLGREARLLAELRHPGIVRYVAHGSTSDGTPYLAMEWLEGEDLSAKLTRTGPLSLLEVMSLARHVAEALGAAHTSGILHRDIKPQNLFLPDGELSRAKLVDFGIARSLSKTHSLTRSQAFLGTPSYAAPEQVRDTREVDARADIFSLGCVLFECLTGRPPFQGEHVMAILAKVLFEEAPHVSELRADVPEALGDLIARMLAKDPAQRPADGSQVSAELAPLSLEGAPPSSPVRARPPRVARGEGEQRLVSIILATPTADLNPDQTLSTEDVTGPFERLRELIPPSIGKVDRLLDGSIIVVFSGKNPTTEQVVQAARYALEINSALPTLEVALVTGRSVLDGQLPVGEVIDRAVALIRARTEPGPAGFPPSIRVDDLTAGLIEPRFSVSGDPGKRLLLGGRDADEGMRKLLGKPTPCIGRERELAALQGFWNECREEPLARAVLVVAEPGVGKSRLRYEFIRSVRSMEGPAPTIWLAQGDPIHTGLPFGLIAQVLRHAAGLLDGAPLELRQARLRTRVGRHLPAEEAARVTEFFGELVGTPFPDHDNVQLRSARRDPVLMSEQVKNAWGRFLSAECEAHPLLLVIEDLHWSDTPSVQLVDTALQRLREQPFMVLALARPEVRELFPKLWQASAAQEVRLDPLSRKACKILAREVLGDTVPEARIERAVEQAAGNAFFLEEILRAVAEGAGGALPDTVLAMMQSRLEALEPEARGLMRAASVIGEAFWPGGVAALRGNPLEVAKINDWLTALTDREFLRRRSDSKLPSELEYTFRHALVREAAYASFKEEERVLGHRLAAEWLEQACERDGLNPAEHSAMIGLHFMRGQAWQKAVDHLQQAGDAAARLSADTEARTHYKHILECIAHLPSTDEHRQRRMDAIMGYQSMVWLDESLESSRERLAEAERIARTLEGREGLYQLARVQTALGRAQCSAGDMITGSETLNQVIRTAESLNDEDLSARPLVILGVVKAAQGQLAESEACLIRCIPTLARTNDWMDWIMAVGLHATVMAMTGRYAEGVQTLTPLLPHARELNSPGGMALARVYWLYTHFMGGSPAKILEAGQATIEAAQRSESSALVWVGSWMSAWAQALLGEHKAAERLAQQAQVLFDKFGGKLFISDWYMATEAARLFLAGRVPEALAKAEQAVDRARLVHDQFGEGIARRAWGQALAAIDPRQWEQAKAHFAESVRLLEVCGAKLDLARTHRAWGLSCRAQGAHEEARNHLELAATQFQAYGNIDEALSIRALLV